MRVTLIVGTVYIRRVSKRMGVEERVNNDERLWMLEVTYPVSAKRNFRDLQTARSHHRKFGVGLRALHQPHPISHTIMLMPSNCIEFQPRPQKNSPLFLSSSHGDPNLEKKRIPSTTNHHGISTAQPDKMAKESPKTGLAVGLNKGHVRLTSWRISASSTS